MGFDAIFTAMQDLLLREQLAGPVNGLQDLAGREKRRAALKRHLDYVNSHIQQFRTQVHDLPALPSATVVRWAQAVQALPNLVFLEIDTTGLQNDAEIIHTLVLDAAGSVLMDVYAKAPQPLSTAMERLTGIAQEELTKQGIPLNALIDQVRNTLSGKYVLSYNLPFDARQLKEATARLEQTEITIIGEDLMKWAMAFFGISSYPKLEGLCRRIGHPLPEHPNQTALDRARGQQALLNAIANAITGVPSSPIDTTTDSEGDDTDEEHPF